MDLCFISYTIHHVFCDRQNFRIAISPDSHPLRKSAAVAEALRKIPQTITDAAVFCKSVQDASDLNQRLENGEYALKVAELLARNAPAVQKEAPLKHGF